MRAAKNDITRGHRCSENGSLSVAEMSRNGWQNFPQEAGAERRDHSRMNGMI